MNRKLIAISVVMFLCVTIAVHAVTVIWGRGIRRATSGGTPWDLTANQVVHYKMNDNAATTVVVDDVGTVNGVLTGGNNTEDLSVAGKINTAIHLDGSADYIIAADSASFDTAGISLSAWVNLDAVDREHFVFSRDSGVEGDRYFLSYIGSNNKLRCYTWNAGNSAVTFDGSNTLSASTWYHITMTYTSGMTKVYLNGVVDGSTATQTGSLKTGNEPLYLGVQNYAGTFYSYLDGKLDDLRYFNRVLTVDEISLIYNSGNGTEASSNP